MDLSTPFEYYIVYLKVKTDQVTNPVDGALIIGDPIALKKPRGWYIGAWCFEFMGGDWVAQPYYRYTEYFVEKKDAITYWDYILGIWRIGLT